MMVASDQNRPQVNAFGHLLIRKQELSWFLHNLNNPAINSTASLENAETASLKDAEREIF